MALEGLLEGHHRPLKAVRRLSPRESGVELSARMFFGVWRAAVSGRIAFAVCGSGTGGIWEWGRYLEQ